MPKRKAVGPADSDGEDDTYYSFPNTPVQSPFPKSIPNNFNLPSSFKPSLPPTSSSMFGFGGRPIPKAPEFAKAPTPGPNKPQGSSLTNPKPVSTNSNSASGSSNQEFGKGMRDLNKAFQKYVRNAVSKNASDSLLPLCLDYMYYSRVLMEQFKKGSPQADLVNGIDLPSKNFKSLGEYFDNFEKLYVNGQVNQGDAAAGNAAVSTSSSALGSKKLDVRWGQSNQEETTAGNASASISSTLNSKYPPAATETSSKSPFNSIFNAVSSSSPLKSFDGNKSTLSAQTNSASSTSSTVSPTKLGQERTTDFQFGSVDPSATVAIQKQQFNPAPSITDSSTVPPMPKPPALTPFAGFSFFTPPAPSTSTSVGSSTAPTSVSNPEEKTNDEDGEEDEPPKVEVTQVKEDDAVYSIRCKVFGVVDGKPKDKGIGMLYIKKLEDGRHQVVVRADNNLGTVILNILLQKSLPLEKNGKNSIMTMDLQANDKKGMPIFIRVKTEDDAIQLLDKLKEFQKAS